MKLLKTMATVLIFLLSALSIAQVNYYASNRVLNAVNSYSENGDYLDEFIEKDAGGLNNPQDIVLHPDGFLLVTGTGNAQIKKFDTNTGDYIEDWSDPTFDLGSPSKMTIGPDSLLYVTQWGTTAATAKIVRFDLNGNYLGPFTPLAPTGLGHVWDAQGNFYLAVFGVSTGVGEVRKYDPNGNFIENFIDTAILENPTYIWWDTNGDMLVQDFTAGKVLRYDNDGNYINEFITGLNQPEGYQYLPNGNLLISERGANQISEYESNGTYIGRWDDGGTLAGPNFIKRIDDPIAGVSDTIKVTFVTPTVGQTFLFDQDKIRNVAALKIYNVLGELIQIFDGNTTHQWDASAFSEGVYFINATLLDGKIATQKIVVKR